MEKLNPWQLANATALTTAVMSLICAAAVHLFPEGTINFINSWTQGIDLAEVRNVKPLNLINVALGLFNVIVTGFLVGTLFAFCYNLIRKYS